MYKYNIAHLILDNGKDGHSRFFKWLQVILSFSAVLIGNQEFSSFPQ